MTLENETFQKDCLNNYLLQCKIVPQIKRRLEKSYLFELADGQIYLYGCALPYN